MKRNILLHITNVCNMCCSYCYNKTKTRNGHFPLNLLSKLNEWIDILHKQGDVIQVILIGGEPSVVPVKLRYFMETLLCDTFQIMTNGYHWSNHFKDTLLTFKEKLILTISFDGLFQDLRAVHSSEAVIKNIEWARDNGLNVNLSCTSHPSHKNRVFENLKYLLSFNVSVGYKRNCDHVLWTNQDYYDVLKELDDILDLCIYMEAFTNNRLSLPSRLEQGLACTCKQRSGLFSCDEYVANDIVVDTDGKVYPCEVYAAHKCHELGNVCCSSIEDILKQQERLRSSTKRQQDQVCPFYNEMYRCDPGVNILNGPADDILWRHREKLDCLKKKATSIKEYLNETN